MTPDNFTPNTSCGPCLYCGSSSEGQPQTFLACDLCHRPLHMSCLLAGPPITPLLGDNFFKVICNPCSPCGKESVKRPNLSIFHLLLLVMYNLHMKESQSSYSGFFHWKIHICRLLSEHLAILTPNLSQRKKLKHRRSIPGMLNHYSGRFFTRGEKGWYCLTKVAPPAVALAGESLGGLTGWELLPTKVSSQSQVIKKESPETTTTKTTMPSTATKPSQSPQPIQPMLRIKVEPGADDDDCDNEDDWSDVIPPISTSTSSSSFATWYTKSDFLTPDTLLPKAIFEGDMREEGMDEWEEEEEEDEEGFSGFSSDLGRGIKEEITIQEEMLNFDEDLDTTPILEDKDEDDDDDKSEIEIELGEEEPLDIRIEGEGIEEEERMEFFNISLGRETEEEEEESGGRPEFIHALKTPSLFPSSSSSSIPPDFLPSRKYSSTHSSKQIRRMNHYEERVLLHYLDGRTTAAAAATPSSSSPLAVPLPSHLYRLRRKLAVRRQKTEHGLPLFNLDEEMEYWQMTGMTRTKKQRMAHQGIINGTGTHHHHQHSQNHYLNNDSITTNSLTPTTARILDRFQVQRQQKDHQKKDIISFAARLLGSDLPPSPIYSPYTLRYLKPYIYRDNTCTPPRLKLLREIVSHHHRGEEGWQPDPQPPIDYCYVTPHHIPSMNQLARHFFWPGIDLSEVLQYPDHTCVVLYRRLVLGFGVLVPDTSYNEAYLSFLLVHPDWRRAGIATFILYHLIQSCQGKDVTLHVSATNPALILYQQFGFKVEEFLSNFYDKYLPDDSPECKHAMFMRLSR